jgi:hypothetical protein
MLKGTSEPSSFGEFAPSIFKMISHCYLGLLQDYYIVGKDETEESEDMSR